MQFKKKKNYRKTQQNVVKLGIVETNVEKVRKLLCNNENPTVTFFFKPHALKFTAKDSNGIQMRMKVPSKTIDLTEDFLRTDNGALKSYEQIAEDIEALAHDYDADKFII